MLVLLEIAQILYNYNYLSDGIIIGIGALSYSSKEYDSLCHTSTAVNELGCCKLPEIFCYKLRYYFHWIQKHRISLR